MQNRIIINITVNWYLQHLHCCSPSLFQTVFFFTLWIWAETKCLCVIREIASGLSCYHRTYLHVGSDAMRLKRPVPQKTWQIAATVFPCTRACSRRPLWITNRFLPSPAQLFVSILVLIQSPILHLYLAKTFFFLHQYLSSCPTLI